MGTKMRRNCFILFFALLTLVFTASLSAEPTIQNPIVPEFNQPIPFDQFTAEAVNNASEQTIQTIKTGIQQIAEIKPKERTFQNTMKALDNLYDLLNTVWGEVYLMAYTHPDDSLREACNNVNIAFEKFANELNMDETIFQAVKEYAKTKEAKSLKGYQKKYLTETLRDFRRNGFDLPKKKREELKALQDQLSEVSNQFSKNIRDYQDSLIVTEEEIQGLPEDYKKERRREDGTYKIDMTYPSIIPFYQYAESDQARKALYMKYNNRAADKNLDVLNDMLRIRQKIVDMLKYKTYADYQIETRMAKTPKAVWDFEYNLIDQLKEKAKLDYEELLEAKRTHTGNPNADTIYPWEKTFYNTLLLRTKYSLDPEEVKQYFELNNVLNGLFTITQTLFDVTYQEVKDAPVWANDVRMFEVYQDGLLVGRFYLDLFPRQNKFTHAASFTLLNGRETNQGYQLPAASLVCNFPKPTEDTPSLLSHDETSTMFHEFGHMLHGILTRSPLSGYAGTSVVRDFVEVPSQLMENWIWNYDALQLFAKHYQTGEILPKTLYDKMIATKNLNSGNNNLQQVYYGLVDMTYNDGFDPNGEMTTTDIVKNLQNEVTLFPYVEGSHFQAAFGHLTGYAAGYYGYLWALVYAEDIFSVFEEKGILDKETGIRFRDEILSKGGTEEPMDLIKTFLEREPNQKAFLKSIGLKVD